MSSDVASRSGDLDRLAAVWQRPPGVWGWMIAVNHRTLGARYVATGFTFMVLGGILALLMRTQLATSENPLLDADRYNQVFTMHGVTMMFLFAVPILQGFAIWLIPLLIGTRDVAFPRLNSFGYWVYVTAGVTLWITLIFDVAPNAGWFAYPPLSDGRFSAGMNIDFYATVVSMLEIAALVAAVELVATILTMRAPGMSLNRMPLFAWAILITSVMIIFAMTPLIVATLMLEMDRALGTHFYNQAAGGDPILWQHLFWFFGHPEVYIMLIPPLGMIAAIVSTGSRRPVVGYPLIVLSLVAVSLISFGVWVHHMFATGRAPAGMGIFSVATFAVALPAGVVVFGTLATLWYGRPRLTVPMLYVLGFLFVFIIGGISGVMLGSIPFDLQAHDTYFVVAHFHYVIMGGMFLPLLGGLTHWFPKFTGRIQDARLGVVAFALIFAGINLTFFPMHWTGFIGMPRRVYTYLSGLGWEVPNLASTVGAFVMAAGMAVFVVNWIRSAVSGPTAGPNPWGAGTLEWAVASPPEPYNFSHTPIVSAANPLWERRGIDTAAEDPGFDTEPPFPTEADLPTDVRLATNIDRREVVGTSVLDAVPEQRIKQVGPTPVPMFAAACVAVAFIGLAFHVVFVPIGLAGLAVAIFLWLRPHADEWDMAHVESGPPDALPSNTVAGSHGIRTPVWWGWVWLMVIIGLVVATLLGSYFYLRAGHDTWPLAQVEPRPWLLGGAVMLVLVLVPLPLWAALRSVRSADSTGLRGGLLVGALGGITAVVLSVVELVNSEHDWTQNATTSLEWALLGVLTFGTMVLVLFALVLFGYATKGFLTVDRNEPVWLLAIFATVIAASSVAVFLTVYVVPRVL